MAMYTMELRNYIEMFTQYEENLTMDERIEVGRKHLFDFDYPFFDENYRPQFERNFINEFYMREIGFETEGLFKMRLKHWLNKNMGYYNKLFESELLKYDPLTNAQMTVTHTKKNDKEQSDLRNIDQNSNTHGTGRTDSEQVGNVDTTQTSKTNTTQNSKTDTTQNTKNNTSQDVTRNTDRSDDQFTRDLEGDTPQNRLQLTTGAKGTGILEYASKINEKNTNNEGKTKETEGTKGTNNTDDKGTSNTATTGTSNTDSGGNRKDKTDFTSQDETNVNSKAEQEDVFKSDVNEFEKFVQNRVGKIGVQSYGKLIQDYRETLLRIEVMIHNEMQELFMLVY